MRENRLYGSEGGEAKAFPTPIHAHKYFHRFWVPIKLHDDWQTLLF